MSIDFKTLKGPKSALKWSRRDVPSLDAVIALVPGRTCAVQAGGHLGVFPKRLAQDFVTVITFEPSPELFVAMTANAPEKNVLRYQAALGDKSEMVGLSSRRRDDSGREEHAGLTHVSGPGPIPVLRLDDFHLPVVDLLCLDVEGYEMHALRGAAGTIARCRPVLVVEVNRNAEHAGFSEQEIRDAVAAWGYVCVDRLQSDDVWIPTERVA